MIAALALSRRVLKDWRSMKFASLLFALTFAACHSPGPYGHAVNYAPLSDEEVASKGAREYDPVMATRRPEEWRAATVTLFGVVDTRTAGPNGAALLKLSVRRLEPRNLCGNDKDEDTCRVTVSDKDFGVVYALVQLRGGDDVGPKAVGAQSLVRIIGKIGQDSNPSDGAPIVRADYYRHFPPFTFALRSDADALKR
jgi:hypothetical protein